MRLNDPGISHGFIIEKFNMNTFRNLAIGICFSFLATHVLAEGKITLLVNKVQADYLNEGERSLITDRIVTEFGRTDQYQVLEAGIAGRVESNNENHIFYTAIMYGAQQVINTKFIKDGLTVVLEMFIVDAESRSQVNKIVVYGKYGEEASLVEESVTKLCGQNMSDNQGTTDGNDAESEDPVSEMAENEMPAQDNTETAQAPNSMDQTKPTISITEPVVSRGMRQKGKTILVKGTATDASGIYEVFINGREANMVDPGVFWLEVPLAMGENKIMVRASDTRQNTAEESFTIIRDGDAPPPVTTIKQAPVVSIASGKYYALLIGVQEYRDKSINPLTEPLNDVEKINSLLTSKYTFEAQNITVLKNPLRTAIMDKFDELSRKVTKQDNLLIFYAGHGYWDEQFKQGYWLPSDARKDNRGEWISNGTIVDYIRGIQSNHTLLIADACFSGGIFQTRSAFSDAPPAIEEMYKLSSRKAITSGTLKEVPDRSVFVEYLTKRLSDNNEPYLTAEQLFVSFRTAVINNSPVKQVPQYGEIRESGDEGGDFVFIKK